MKLKDKSADRDEWGGYERIRLGRALELDRVSDCGRNAVDNPGYPEGGMVKALAHDLGVTVEALLEWGAAQDATLGVR